MRSFHLSGAFLPNWRGHPDDVDRIGQGVDDAAVSSRRGPVRPDIGMNPFLGVSFFRQHHQNVEFPIGVLENLTEKGGTLKKDRACERVEGKSKEKQLLI